MKMTSYILLFITLFSCSQKQDKQEEYFISYKNISIYHNIYNSKGQLEKVDIKKKTENEIGENIDYSQKLYYYNSCDSLIKIETYSMIGDIKELSSIEIFRNMETEDIIFRDYPNDTLFYTIRTKDMKGNLIKEYSQAKELGVNNEIPPERTVMNREYNLDNLCILSVRKDLINNTKSKQTFKYDINNDTLFTHIYENDKLSVHTKKYDTKEYTIEVTEYYDSGSIDSLFYKNDKEVYWVSRQEGIKRESFFEYDSHGNITKSEESFYMTKEAYERQKEKWGIE